LENLKSQKNTSAGKYAYSGPNLPVIPAESCHL